MVAPTFIGLPTELLNKIIRDAVPEGFESLALTCKTIHELCIPLIERHNHLHYKFQEFRYHDHSMDQLLSPIRTSLDLIKRIAIEPVVARYITVADLYHDAWPHRARLPQAFPDVHLGGPVATLLANSSHLRQAGLDWKEYYTLIKEDLKERPDYSQHAAAFVLTLLPNVKYLSMPKLWKPLEKTEMLLNIVICNTRQSHFPGDSPSLAQVTKFQSYEPSGAGHHFDLEKAIPFLALPRVQSFRGPSSVAIGDSFIASASKEPYLRYGETLENAYLVGCWINEVAIAEFLKHTPRLKILEYSHSTRERNYPEWDICKFVTAIEREAGSRLEELSISIIDLAGPIILGKASMRAFQRLQKLEFPLELAMCNVANATSRVTTLKENSTDQEMVQLEPFIGDLVPASVSELLLLSSGENYHEEGLGALKVIFRDFANKKDAQLPALKEIHICPPNEGGVDDEFKEECEKLAAETIKAGVVLHLSDWPVSITTQWDWE